MLMEEMVICLCVCGKIDLCKSCSEQLMYLIADFKYKKNKKEREEVKSNELNC